MTDRFELLAEDVRVLGESSPYFTRRDESAPVITCECCGTRVTLVQEALSADGPDRRYSPAIWETACGGMKHTARRCEWKRANPRALISAALHTLRTSLDSPSP